MISKSVADWPDWRGQTAVIVATGPSIVDEKFAQAKGLARFIVIKKSWHLVPWADVLYGSDRGWWFANEGVKEFRGLKISASPAVSTRYRDVRHVRLVKGTKIIETPIGTVGCGARSGGGHSGFHAINLAVQFGSRKIVIAGFDMTAALRAPWCKEMDACAEQFRAMGVQVINVSPASLLKNYEKRGLMEAIAG